MEIPVRMNTTRPVSLCSLWGRGSQPGPGRAPQGTQAEDPSQTPLQTLAGGKWRDPQLICQGGALAKCEKRWAGHFNRRVPGLSISSRS